MNTLDTRDLTEERNDLKEQILDAFNEEFETDFSDFDELPTLIGDDLGEVDNEEEVQQRLEDFKELWEEELKQTKEIDDLEEEVEGYAGDKFDDGIYLINENDFTEYCEEMMEEFGYINRDTPQLIKNNIDWEGIADDLRIDYTEVEFRGDTYLFR